MAMSFIKHSSAANRRPFLSEDHDAVHEIGPLKRLERMAENGSRHSSHRPKLR
jgi:hypothetical protein